MALTQELYFEEEVERKMEFGFLNRKRELSKAASRPGNGNKIGSEDKTM